MYEFNQIDSIHDLPQFPDDYVIISDDNIEFIADVKKLDEVNGQ